MSADSASSQDAPVFYPRPWLVVIAVNFGSIAALASSIGLINLLMPRMMAELAADVQSIQWVQTSFLLTMVVLMPAVGWVGAAVGPKRLYLSSMALFTFGTVLCTLAWDMPLGIRLISLASPSPATLALSLPARPPYKQKLCPAYPKLGN